MLNKYNETLANLDNLTPFKIQKAYMEIVGQINEHGGVLVPANYVHFTKTEIDELYFAFRKNEKNNESQEEMLDALCDIVVCALGAHIMYLPFKRMETYCTSIFTRLDYLSEITKIINFSIKDISFEDLTPEILGILMHDVESVAKYHKFNFDGALLEVFRNNFARLQFDENGNVLKQPEFLADGSKNPDAGKVIKKLNLNPDLRPFLQDN